MQQSAFPWGERGIDVQCAKRQKPLGIARYSGVNTPRRATETPMPLIQLVMLRAHNALVDIAEHAMRLAVALGAGTMGRHNFALPEHSCEFTDFPLTAAAEAVKMLSSSPWGTILDFNGRQGLLGG